jgi:leucine dehydrogenase
MVQATATKHVHYTVCDSLMRYAQYLGFGDIHTKICNKTGLKAIIAIHNLSRGPAIGGARMITYETIDRAYEDAIRLAYMMSYKAAINNLPHGGAKAVIIKPKVIPDREAFFERFGEFVNELNGRYITAVDSGTSPVEMDIIARRTGFVTCTSRSTAAGDPSPLTALGIRRAIEAAVKFKLNRTDLADVRIAIQGAGHVGYYLAKDLVSRGAKVTMTDINSDALQRCVTELGVATVESDRIFDLEGDVFSPCALGSILNKNTIARLKVKIVAGAANNQLAHHHYGMLLHERGILYAPDFLINAGGLIHVAVAYAKGSIAKSAAQINDIYDTVTDIFIRAGLENRATNDIAEGIARDRLHAL